MFIIAYYLPQFYPFKENDVWWGKGFTEWTNVGRARKLYFGHDQPKVPADLGYYDLRLPEVHDMQAEMARRAGIGAFCYWHYWFGGGRVLLDRQVRELLNTGSPDFPFCLGWANESWKAKVWNSADSSKDKILFEQVYPGYEEHVAHFNYVLKAFKDARYLKFEGKPVFIIYKPLLVPDLREFMAAWQSLAKENGFNGVFFIGHTVNSAELDEIMSYGFNAINIVRTGEHRYNKQVIKKIFFKLFVFKFLRGPLVLNYSFISKYFVNREIDSNEFVYPTIIPNWDHTPRSGRKGVVFHGSTPSLFKRHLIELFRLVSVKNSKVVFLKSWNEWGEGNYMEPDQRNGDEYLTVLKETIEEFSS